MIIVVAKIEQAALNFAYLWSIWTKNILSVLHFECHLSSAQWLLTSAGVSVTSVALGAAHTCGVISGNINGVFCSGHNDYGQLGDGSTQDQSSPVPVSLDTGGH